MTKLRCMGIDPGFAKTGIAVVEVGDDEPRLLHLRIVETKKATKKKLNNRRVSHDDQDRLQQIWDAMIATALEWEPAILAYEVYAPRPGKLSAWKTALVTGMIQGMANAMEKPLYPFIPQDLKREFTGFTGKKGEKVDTSKKEVQAALGLALTGWSDMIQAIPESKREHVADAAGHAYLGIQEALNLRAMAGL